MPTLYVRSTDGSDSDNGTTWALAKATLFAGIGAIDAAGDTVWISQNHNESLTGYQSWQPAGTADAPMMIMCGNDGAEPPTQLATSASISSTGAVSLSGWCYVYGIQFTSTGGVVSIGWSGYSQRTEKCVFWTNNSSGTAYSITLGGVIVDCTFRVGHAAHIVKPYESTLIQNCSFHASTVSPTSIFEHRYNWVVDGCDFSMLSSTVNIVKAYPSTGGLGIIKNCKLPSNWSGALVERSFVSPHSRVEMYNCDSGDTNYALYIDDYCGTIRHDTGVYNDAGATNGTTRISWKMVSSANAEYPHMELRSGDIVRWNETTGSSVTVTVEIVHDSQGSGTNGALKDDEIWLEVMYLGTSGNPISSRIADRKTDVLATAADQDSSSATWTGDSAGWDTQKLSVSFTPQEKGFIAARVCLAKASATVYVDPLLTVT